MPGTLPNTPDFHADAFLSGFAIAHGQDLIENFAADRALTLVRSPKKSNKYPIWSKADMFRDDMKEWADGSTTPELGLRLTSGEYTTKRYGGKTLLTEENVENAKGEVEAEQGKIRYLMHQAKIKREKRFSVKIFNTGLWTANTQQEGVSGAPGANQFQFFDETGSDPIGAITAQMNAIETSTGRLPTVGVVDALTNTVLKNHADFIDRIKHTQLGIVTEDLIAQVLGLKKWVVARGTENTAAEGQAASMARIHGDQLLLMHTTDEMSDDEPTAAGLFSWSKFDFVDEMGAAIDSFVEWDRKGTWYRSEQYFEMDITSNDLGVFMNNTLV